MPPFITAPGQTDILFNVMNVFVLSCIAYERDLGPSTEAIVPFIDRFDPDDERGRRLEEDEGRIRLELTRINALQAV
ncbi:DUF2950 domain-containing protein [Sinorhizobium garamanticum]|uniref:DUF2950 domain-containing protein n=1 Tax=Sinorhizobium garamanticum TaxID=680247 RepID=A0ABY8DL81_9HYPH|nr:hypothetical protein [Sinorhizobium garamanticum]WEX91012.1 DUF2950 domain-containing protein [Sinorhizobium garamanticum]